jgi:hypothetical protein
VRKDGEKREQKTEYAISQFRRKPDREANRHPVLIDDWTPALVFFGKAQGKLAHYKSPV